MDDHEPRPTRRIVFHGLGALGVAVALAGCGSDNTGSTEPAPDPSGGSSGGSDGGSADGGGTMLAATGDVPIGGGVILTEAKVVITQPTAGTFDAFSAVCTHQGFLVTSVDGGTIVCAHHGSTYDATTGAVTQGPAPAGLQKVGIVVKGGKILTS